MLLRFIVGAAVSAIVSYFTIKKKALTPAAALESCLMMLIASVFGGYGVLFALVFSFLLVSIAGKLTKDRRLQRTRGLHKKHGTRDAVQVLVNGLFASIAAILYHITSDTLCIALYFAAVTESLADSVASDIGVLSKKPPIDICRFVRVQPGISGGVSLLGTLSAFLCGIIMCGAFIIFYGFELRYFIIITLCPLLGMLIDSVLGSLLQVKYRCEVCGNITEKAEHCGVDTKRIQGLAFIDNDMVNLIANGFSVLLGVLISSFTA